MRLPDSMELERQMIASLKARAEVIKIQLDAIVQLVSPSLQPPCTVVLCLALQGAMHHLRRQYPTLPVKLEPSDAAVCANPHRLGETLALLLLALAETAVALTITLGEANEPSVTIRRLGAAATAEQLEWIDHPFPGANQSLLGLALACTAQVVRGSGGSICAENEPESLVIRLRFPSLPDASCT